MTLKYMLDTLDGVPEAIQPLYVERDGRFVLQVEGVAPKAKIDEFRDTNVALQRELNELRTRFDGIDPEQARQLAERAQKERDKKLIDAGKVEELIGERIGVMRAEHEKVLKAREAREAELTKQLESLVIDGAIRDAAAKSGVRASAIEDVLLRGRQVFRLENGQAVPYEGDKPVYNGTGEPMPIGEWVGKLAERAPHLFESNQGGGAPKPSNTAPGGKKTITRSQFEALDPAAKIATAREATIVD